MSINKRYIGAAIIAPFILFIFMGGIYLKYFTIAISLAGLYEFYKTAKLSKIKTFDIVGYALLVIFYVTNNNFESLSYIIIIATFLMLCLPVLKPALNYIDVAVTIFGFIYVGVFFSCIYLVNVFKGGEYLVWLVFLGSWGCDTGAYYVGRLFSKFSTTHKLNPEVSPNKTIEGSVGGLIICSLLCGIFGIILINKFNFTNVALYHYFIIGGLCGVFSQFGDLVASSIKRHSNIKDYSNLIPGHGGILDRFDSSLYSAVVVFMYLKLLLMM